MTDSQKQWTPLEHEIYRALKAQGVNKMKCLLAVSGGGDSVALLLLMDRLRTALNLELEVAVCHHGPPVRAEDPAEIEQQEYRESALLFVQKTCEMLRDVPCWEVRSEQTLKNENQMRVFRKTAIENLRKSRQCDFSLWAHHQEDVLETHIMRMIRGSGAEKGFEPMKFQSAREIRPLLGVSKRDLLDYVRMRGFSWIEDPSNGSDVYLRNWIRNTWLPQLEKKCPGALQSFSRSLGLLQEALELGQADEPEGLRIGSSLSRTVLLSLPLAQRKQILAQYIRSRGVVAFTHNHIEEVIRHLDNSQLNHTFHCAGLKWDLSKDLISAKALLL